MNHDYAIPPDVRNKLDQLTGKSRTGLWIAAIFSRLAALFVVLVFSSLFLGFIGFMRTATGGDGFFKWFSIPFYVIFFLVFAITFQKRIYNDLRDWFPSTNITRRQSWLFAAILVIPMMFLGHYLGTNYLGDELSAHLLGRWALGLGALVAVGIPGYLAQGIETRFIDKYKREMLPEMVKDMPGHLSYDHGQFETEKQFTESELFLTTGTIISFKGSDRIHGIDGRTQFSLSQLHVRVKEVTQSDGKTKVEIKDLFKGILFNADFNKTFEGKVLVFPDHARGMFGSLMGESLNTLVNRPGMHSVMMEDPIFEERFTVIASDKVLARYILTPKLMERLVELEHRLGYDLSMSFINGHLYLALEYDRDFFRPPILGRLNNPHFLQRQYNLLRNLVTIPELLDLETRVWMKE